MAQYMTYQKRDIKQNAAYKKNDDSMSMGHKHEGYEQYTYETARKKTLAHLNVQSTNMKHKIAVILNFSSRMIKLSFTVDSMTTELRKKKKASCAG